MVGQREAFGASDKAFYSREIDYYTPEKQKGLLRHMSIVEANIDAVWPFLQELQRAKGGRIDVLELGAGTCTASLLLRKRAVIGRHVCVDISEHRMASLIAQTATAVGVPVHEIELVEADFTYALPMPDRSFDLVLFDGALHHSRSIWTTLEQCRRVLRPGGCVAALREAALGRLTYGYAMQRMTRSPEAKAGVAENAYLKEQYMYYFKVTGFEPKFVGVYPDWKWKLLAPLNGLVISKWAIWAPLRPD